MALANSSLSIAADKIAEIIENAISDVRVVVDTPSATQKQLDNSPQDSHLLNLFFYRIAPSAVHAAQLPNEPLFLRLFALLTPFPKKQTANSEDHPALRMLGQVVRFFHENPVGPVLQTPLGANGTIYRLQSILQAPNMEELNHIWTTQGSDLGYRMSAAYEFALVPVDPSQMRTPDGDVLEVIYQVNTTMEAAGKTPAPYSAEFLTGPETETFAALPHLHRLLIVGPSGPTADLAVDMSSPALNFAVAGPEGDKAEITFSVRDQSGTEIRSAKEVVTLATVRLDVPEAVVSLAVDLSGGAVLVAEIRPADGSEVPLEPQRVGNTLTLQITGATP